MPTNGPFPTPDEDFSVYINNAIPYLITNKGRLMVSDANATLMNTQKTTWNPLFLKVKDPAQATTALRNDKTALRKTIETTMRLVFGDVPESALTETDRATLNLKKRDTTPSPRPHITTQPFVEMQPMGGARVKITTRVQNDGSRASLHPDADSIEMAYVIGGTAPSGLDGTPTHIVFTKAIHTLEFAVNDEGKRVYAYMKWKNDSDDAKSGPWSNLVQVIIA